MRTALAVLLVVHGAIHVLGFAKAFGLADLPQLPSAIPRPLGVLWLTAALALVTSAAVLFLAPRAWPIAALVAIVLSQAAIATAWHEAKFGTLANAIIAVPLVLALLDMRGTSLRSLFERDVERGLASAPPSALVTEADLEKLPSILQTYLRRTGALGKPRVHDFRARWHGEMKLAPDGPWTKITAEQVSLTSPPARYFFVEASRWGMPFEGLHRYEGSAATMKIRAAGLFDVVDAKGPEMTHAETVTVFDDMCALAPASLVDAPVVWTETGPLTVHAVFTNAGNTIEADLVFDREGDLVDFVSSDRSESADGKTFRRYPWSTALGAYREFGAARVASYGEAIWRHPEGDAPYARFELESLEYNVASELPGPAPDRVADHVAANAAH